MFGEKRVYRFVNADGAAQISPFPDTPPTAPTDLQVRIRHFTEIENFTFLAYVLAHELGGEAQQPVTLGPLTVEDPDVMQLVIRLRGEALTDEQLGDQILDVGIDWEHDVASFDSLMIPGDPLRISDIAVQREIDALDELTEALVAEVNRRSAARRARDDQEVSHDRG